MGKKVNGRPNQRTPIRSVLLITSLLVLVLLGILSVYLWQHNKVSTLNKETNQQRSKLQGQSSSISSLQKQVTNLTNQLQQAHNTIQSLTSSNNYVVGSSCQPEQLSLTLAANLPSASGGARGELFSFKNTSSSACSLSGSPGFLALDSTGHVIPDGPIKTGGYPSSSVTSYMPVTLNPNGQAYFALTWNDFRGFYPTPPAGLYCLSPSIIESTPPGQLYPVITQAQGQDICNDNLSISAIYPISTFDLPPSFLPKQ